MEIIKRMPQETKKKLIKKGYFFSQDGCVLEYLRVSPNCLFVPIVVYDDSIMSSDPAMSVLIYCLS